MNLRSVSLYACIETQVVSFKRLLPSELQGLLGEFGAERFRIRKRYIVSDSFLDMEQESSAVKTGERRMLLINCNTLKNGIV